VAVVRTGADWRVRLEPGKARVPLETATSSQVTPGWLMRPSAVLAVAGARIALISDATLEGCEALATKTDEGGTDGSTG
jgi:hypothetical protein